MERDHELDRKARTLEAVGQHAAALDCYRTMLPGATGLSRGNLLARAGLLHLQIGQIDEAVASLKQATSLYVESGLKNVAVALCERALRADPEQEEFETLVAELRRGQGYQVDSRRACELLAERALARGDEAAALELLKRHLAHFPNDAMVRRKVAALGGALDDHRAGEPTRPTAAEHSADSSKLGLVSTAEPDSAPAQEVPSLLDDSSTFGGAADQDITTLEGLEPTSSVEDERGVRDQQGPLELLGTGPDEWQDPAAQQMEKDEPLPLLLPRSDARANDGGVDEASSFARHEDELPVLGDPAHGEPYRETASSERAAPVDEIRARLRDDPSDLAAHRLLTDLLTDTDAPIAELEAALTDARAAAANAGDDLEAARFAQQLASLRPGGGPALRTWLEHAFRSGSAVQLLPAYLAVARHFTSGGKPEESRAVYLRALTLDPNNAEARAAAAKGADGDEYVDFAALVLDEQGDSEPLDLSGSFGLGDGDEIESVLEALLDSEAAGSDRVAAVEGDGSGNSGDGDQAGEYDLGIAYREMGLFDAAIGHFRVALEMGSNPVATREMLGECLVESGAPEEAAQILHTALHLPGTPAAQLVGIHYWLGRAHEALGAYPTAASDYERVRTMDASFRDVASRLESVLGK